MYTVKVASILIYFMLNSWRIFCKNILADYCTNHTRINNDIGTEILVLRNTTPRRSSEVMKKDLISPPRWPSPVWRIRHRWRCRAHVGLQPVPAHHLLPRP